ncbi:MAG: gliding motility-associated-like protein [Flavobacterium sp.]|jgi:gliding motility-associated-like protein
MRKLYTIIFLVLFSCPCFSQLSSFTLTVNTINETCPANGSLTFGVSNTTTGATILYSIYRFPNLTTPIGVTSTNSFTGLISGNYRVVATQSQGNNFGTQQQDVTVLNQIVALNYQIVGSNVICGNDGKITINTLTASAVSYELFGGPIIRPLQTSNVFSNLVPGQYQIRVFDSCGEGVVQTFTLLYSNPQLSFTLSTPALSSCTTVDIGFNFETAFTSGVVKYPLQINTTVNYNGAATQSYSSTITNGLAYSLSIPFSANQPYSYSFQITDGCGVVYNLTGFIQNLSTSVIYNLITQTCSFKSIKFNNAIAVTLISAPTNFSTSLPIDYTSQLVNNSITIPNLVAGTYVFTTTNICGVNQTFSVVVTNETLIFPFSVLVNRTCISSSVLIYNIQTIIMTNAPASYQASLPQNYTALINAAGTATFLNLPIGNYTFAVTNSCGEPEILNVNITPVIVPTTFQILQGCQIGYGTLKLNGQFQTINLISAPNGFTQTLPLNLSANIILNGSSFTLDNLISGTYIFQIIDSCGNSTNSTVSIAGYQETTTINVLPNCGSFDLQLNHTSNNAFANNFYLQKYNTITGGWMHPSNGTNYVTGTIPNAGNSFPLVNNTTNFNLAFSGSFRILKVLGIYQAGQSSATICSRVIREFDFIGVPKINAVYSIACNGNFEVIVDAVSFSPLIYRITTKDGQPFLVQNGSSNVFTNLAAGTYNFQVEDQCGTILNNLFQVINPNPLQITPTSFCNGQSGSLSVPNFPFLTYQWYNTSNSSVILSTSNSLNFTPFNSNNQSGTYLVQINYNGNPNSCLNQTLSYTISAGNANPNAGQDVAVAYCGSQGILNLTNLLQGNFDSNGTFSETTSSNALTGSFWDSSLISNGTFQFVYRVNGSCDLFDESVLTITINPIPINPEVSASNFLCIGENINLFATAIPNTTYSWIGPNGYTSNDQNPIIENASILNSGIYFLTVSLGTCQSAAVSVNIQVHVIPNFEIIGSCDGTKFILDLVSGSDDLSLNLNTITWVGPNGFSSNLKTIDITNLATGDYIANLTNEFGCSLSKIVTVNRTICFITNLITANNDGKNDSFNLDGFDVLELEIFNRWGTLVYNRKNYTNQWFGQNNNGNKVPDGVYFYLIRTAAENKTGWIFVQN